MKNKKSEGGKSNTETLGLMENFLYCFVEGKNTVLDFR